MKRRLHDWDAVFLKDALKRLQKDLDGYELALEDVKDFMEVSFGPREKGHLASRPDAFLFPLE